MKITIAGYGFVGKAHEALLKNLHDITIYDPALGYHDIGEPDAVIICVSTPQSTDGSCYYKNVSDVISLIDKSTPILVKSTISIDGWAIVNALHYEHKISYSPEFLRAATAIEDILKLRHMYVSSNIDFWHHVFTMCDIDMGKADELILVKYFRNSFLATKVAFFNQIYDLCNATNIDYDRVSQFIAEDPRIGYSHTQVTKDRGFGGHCFPKDTSAIVKTAELYDVDLSLIKEAIEYNNKVRKCK